MPANVATFLQGQTKTQVNEQYSISVHKPISAPVCDATNSFLFFFFGKIQC